MIQEEVSNKENSEESKEEVGERNQYRDTMCKANSGLEYQWCDIYRTFMEEAYSKIP